MSYSPLVSVITIVYNGENHIEQTINSVLNQSYKNIEYIIIDGGSKDNTVSIIKKYQARIAYWVSESDAGISDAFNKGLAKAAGEIVGIINADDWYEINTISLVVTAIESYDVAYGYVQYWTDFKKSFKQKSDVAYLEQQVSVIHPTVFVKKTCYDRFGVFNKNYKCAMDYELLLRLKVNHCKFVYIPSVLANMRWEGLSDQRWMLGCRETLKIKNHYFTERKFGNYVYFYKNVVAISVIKFFEKIHLGFLIRFYRQKFSRLKTYN
ncbi:MAG: glycosyltransferase family 2 protein [Ginsengibacter sp.]